MTMTVCYCASHLNCIVSVETFLTWLNFSAWVCLLKKRAELCWTLLAVVSFQVIYPSLYHVLVLHWQMLESWCMTLLHLYPWYGSMLSLFYHTWPSVKLEDDHIYFLAPVLFWKEHHHRSNLRWGSMARWKPRGSFHASPQGDHPTHTRWRVEWWQNHQCMPH